ncbi:MAG: hypothetical protein ACI4PG_07795 [Candidatus Ventricola sp.]
MIDEFVDRMVDRGCEAFARSMRPRAILLANSALGWRVCLYLSTAGRRIADAFHNISNEENADSLWDELDLRMRRGIQRLRGGMSEGAAQLARLEAWGQTIRFCMALLLLGLCALGVAARGGRGGAGQLALLGASLCVLWLSVAVESGYAPVARGLRQTYLIASLLRAGAFLPLLLGFFRGYLSQGVPSNIVLQCAMVAMMIAHAVLFCALIAFNTRQLLLLRVLSGVTGLVPALTLAAAAAMAAACLFQPWPAPLAGAAGAAGALLAFLGDALMTLRSLGGIRLKYYSIWVCLLMSAGYVLMLVGAWTGV